MNSWSSEVWLDPDMLWFGEQPRNSLLVRVLTAAHAHEVAFPPISTGLDASRRRRLAKQAARKRRLATRTAPAVALVLGSATMLPIYASRYGNGSRGASPLSEDPPSLTFRFDPSRVDVPELPFTHKAGSARAPASASEFEEVEWHHAASVGLPYSGRLSDGTQLPVEGPDWVTWNPVTDSVPNVPHRLFGNEHTIRAILSVIGGYRAAHPDAPRVVVGDISFREGGQMDEHVSHQNGLDVDVYYPRLDGRLSAPIATSQIDRRLAQDLLNRFITAGVQMVFVGYSTGLHGPRDVVVPYANHENHMHVRFVAPSA